MSYAAPLSRTAFRFRPEQYGVSNEANCLRKGLEEVHSSIIGTLAMGTQYHRILVDLSDARREAASANWDGQGALPVDGLALLFSQQFARMLPNTNCPVEVSVDPDGEVSFDWYAGPRRSLSVSVGPTGTLRYASILGGSEAWGSEPWCDGVPEAIGRLLHEIDSLDE